MAFSTLNRSCRSQFFALPAHARLQAYQSARSFAASSSHKASFVDIAVAGPNAVLDGIHSLGLPWAVTLPVTAVLVRTVLVPYISTRAARRKAQLRNQLVPLAGARLHQEMNTKAAIDLQRDRREKDGYYHNDKLFSRNAEARDRKRMGSRIMRNLLKDFGMPPYVPRGAINFGILIAFTEAIRMKCGSREGLLPLLLKPFEWVGSMVFPSWSPPPPLPPPPPPVAPAAVEPAQSFADRAWAARESQEATLGLHTPVSLPDRVETSSLSTDQYSPAQGSSLVPAPQAASEANPYFDPTMQTEGLPWLSDLTLSDPNILPVVLLLSMSATTVLVPRLHDGFMLTGMQRVGLVLACLFSLCSLSMPAAVILYFVPSVLAGWLHGRYMDYKHPIQPAIAPCKRPIRMKVRRNS